MRLLNVSGFCGSFRAKVFIKVFTLIIAVSGAFIFVFVQHEKKSLSDSLVKNGLALANLFAYSSRLGAFSENPYFLKDPVEGLAKREEVTSVSVFTAEGRLLSDRGKADKTAGAEQRTETEKFLKSGTPGYLEKADYFEFWAPILVGPEELSAEALFYGTGSSSQKDRVIGFVKIDIGKSILRKSFRSLLTTSLFIAAVFLLAGAIISYFMVKNVTGPLSRLTEGVRAIEEGRSALPVPLQTEDEIGILTKAFNSMAESLREREAQLRSLASRLSLIEERERRRIATDLHDNLGQTLAVSKMRLGTLKGCSSSEDVVDAVNKISELVDEAIRYTRSLTSELSPPILYSFGFAAAVEWLVEQFQEQHGIWFEFEDDGAQKTMNEETQVLLFRVVRELLFNIVKHAQAKNAKVRLGKDGDFIRVVVEDDGVGFDASSVFGRRGSFGLFSIRERLRYLGGRLEVDSRPGKGTRVVLSALLKKE